MGIGDRLINTSSNEVYTYDGMLMDYYKVLNSNGDLRHVSHFHFARYYVPFTEELYAEIIKLKETKDGDLHSCSEIYI